MRAVAIRGLLIGGLLFAVACAEGDGGGPAAPPPTLSFVVQSAQVGIILPGTDAALRGNGFLSDAAYDATLEGVVDGRPVSVSPAVEYVDDLTLRLRFDPATVDALGAGTLAATVTVEARLGLAVGSATVALDARVAPSLTPQVINVAPAIFPASPVVISGEDFIAGEEGDSLVALRGSFEVDGGPTVPLEQAGVATRPANPGAFERRLVQFVFDPNWVGIQPGRFVGEIQVTNVGATGWRGEGAWVPVSFDLLPPVIERVTPTAASRGQAINIEGQGFLGGVAGGLTTLRLEGSFVTSDGTMVPLPPGGLEITPTWKAGTSLVFSLRPRYEFDCTSADLGATPGALDGTVTPVIVLGDSAVEGDPAPLRFEILPTRQVVHLVFLPAFTDSLRLFGLRNLSGLVKDRVVEIIERDYAGINLEIRLQTPTDFLEFSVVEVGGPDPNAQQLFGLDNTTGLDRCNQRLDDNLAGQNADSNGAYGGIFVESFLQLSPRRGDNPLATEIFDEIFDPVIDQPVDAGEFPGGARDAAIERAVHTLGSLVGNTVTHEIGHSLGLPVAPGCGQYHNAPGDLQIMDCGADRPFAERAELIPGQFGVWTNENRAYLERILPLR